MIRTSDIRIDGGTQARAAIDQATVDEYAEAMADPNTVFPPLSVYHDGKSYWLADGFHRLAAWIKIGREEVPADVRQGDRRRAILHSVAANSAHGLRRTNADKRRAVMTLLEDEEWSQWSDREIARRCAVSPSFVGGLRGVSVHDGQIAGSAAAPAADVDTARRTVQRGGATFQQNAAKIGKAKPLAPESADPPAPQQPAQDAKTVPAAPPSEPAADAPLAEPDPHAKLRAEFQRLTPQAQEDDWIGLREALAEEKEKRRAAEAEAKDLKALLKQVGEDHDGWRSASALKEKLRASEQRKGDEMAKSARLQRQVNAQKAEIEGLKKKFEAQEITL